MSLTKAIEKIRGMKENKPGVIPMDNYVNRLERNAGHNDAIDKVLTILEGEDE